LLGGAGALAAVATCGALVETEVLPGRSRLRDVLGLTGPEAPIPDVEAGPMTTGVFGSAERGGVRTGWAVSYPPGNRDGDALPVLVALHGRGADHRTCFDLLGLDRFLALAVEAGVPPFAVASVDGGDRYWHERSAGDDGGAMVTEEFLPLLAGRGLRTDRLGLFGWSMGGYGALLLATETPARAVAVSSPALWTDPGSSSPGSFDDAADFAAHDVFDRREELQEIPLLGGLRHERLVLRRDAGVRVGTGPATGWWLPAGRPRCWLLASRPHS